MKDGSKIGIIALLAVGAYMLTSKAAKAATVIAPTGEVGPPSVVVIPEVPREKPIVVMPDIPVREYVLLTPSPDIEVEEIAPLLLPAITGDPTSYLKLLLTDYAMLQYRNVSFTKSYPMSTITQGNLNGGQDFNNALDNLSILIVNEAKRLGIIPQKATSPEYEADSGYTYEGAVYGFIRHNYKKPVLRVDVDEEKGTRDEYYDYQDATEIVFTSV